jgi:hypothetical protein
MRRQWLLCGALACSMAGCGESGPTEVGAPATATTELSVSAGTGRVSYSYDDGEAKELRRSLLLSYRNDQPIARGRRNAILLRSFVAKGDSFHYALAYGERTGPPKYSVLLKNGKPVSMIRYEWRKRAGRWQSESAQLTFWNSRGEPVITGGARGEKGALREISAIVERVTYAVLAKSVRAANAQLYIEECFSEYMDLVATAAALAAAIGLPDPTLLTKLLILTLSSAYAKAVFKLNACIDEQSGTSTGPHEGTGGGETEGSGGGAGGGGGGGDPDPVIELIRMLVEDCEERGGSHCVYSFS